MARESSADEVNHIPLHDDRLHPMATF